MLKNIFVIRAISSFSGFIGNFYRVASQDFLMFIVMG